jgi:hypothetical protein
MNMTTATERITYSKVLKLLPLLPPICPREELAALADEKILLPKSNITINVIKTNK